MVYGRATVIWRADPGMPGKAGGDYIVPLCSYQVILFFDLSGEIIDYSIPNPNPDPNLDPNPN